MQTIDETGFGSFDREGVRHWVKKRTGLRRSARLDAAVAVVQEFGPVGLFHRAQVIEALAWRYYWKCLDRAVDALLAGGCVYEVDGVPLTKGGGRTYALRLEDLAQGVTPHRGGLPMPTVQFDDEHGHEQRDNGYERQDWGFDDVG